MSNCNEDNSQAIIVFLYMILFLFFLTDVMAMMGPSGAGKVRRKQHLYFVECFILQEYSCSVSSCSFSFRLHSHVDFCFYFFKLISHEHRFRLLCLTFLLLMGRGAKLRVRSI